jgi:hypothetical protein
MFGAYQLCQFTNIRDGTGVRLNVPRPRRAIRTLHNYLWTILTVDDAVYGIVVL